MREETLHFHHLFCFAFLVPSKCSLAISRIQTLRAEGGLLHETSSKEQAVKHGRQPNWLSVGWGPGVKGSSGLGSGGQHEEALVQLPRH